MTPQFLSEKMCRFLSSLVPGFEGHWNWYSNYTMKGKKKIPHGEPWVMCEEAERGGDSIGEFTGIRICPAWQVEDLFTHLQEFDGKINEHPGVAAYHIFQMLGNWKPSFGSLEAAYQKIEEYLWSMLK